MICVLIDLVYFTSLSSYQFGDFVNVRSVFLLISSSLSFGSERLFICSSSTVNKVHNQGSYRSVKSGNSGKIKEFEMA